MTINAKLGKRSKLAIRLLEIDAEVKKKYNISEPVPPSYTISGSGENYPMMVKTPINLDEYAHYMSNAKMLEKLKDVPLNPIVAKTNIDIAIENIKLSYNDGIGPEIEEFWLIVHKEGLQLKRTNNRLMNILKKGVVTTLENKEIFYLNINRLLQSEIFGIVYDNEIKQRIFETIEASKNILVKKMETFIKKKNLTKMDLFNCWGIYTENPDYFEVLNIPEEITVQFKNFIESNENFKSFLTDQSIFFQALDDAMNE